MMFRIIVVGRNCAVEAAACLDSIDCQSTDGYQVCVIDDASTDGTAEIVAEFVDLCDDRWSFFANTTRVGAMVNQWDAWHHLGVDADDDDVFMWVDLDDALADAHSLATLAAAYERTDALVSYGSYMPSPASATCPPAQAYPDVVAQCRAFRQWCRERRGILHNHTRAMRWSVLRQITEMDCQDSRGRWWMSGPDMAVYLPALEIAGPRAVFFPEVTYRYTSDRAESEWRAAPDLVRRNHEEMFRRTPKVPVKPLPRVAPPGERQSSTRVRRPRQVPARIPRQP